MRRVALLGVFCLLVVGAASAAGDAVNRPLLGIAGQADRFKTQTGQDSQIRHAFLGGSRGASGARRSRSSSPR